MLQRKCYDSDVSSLAGAKKIEEEQFLNVFIQCVWTSVARLESLVSPSAVSGFEKESLKRRSFE